VSPTINLDVEGPEWYCPDCHRWLARATDHGTFDLAHKASIILVAELPVELEEDEVNEVPTLMVEARCHLLRCRLRRWLRGRR